MIRLQSNPVILLMMYQYVMSGVIATWGQKEPQKCSLWLRCRAQTGWQMWRVIYNVLKGT